MDKLDLTERAQLTLLLAAISQCMRNNGLVTQQLGDLVFAVQGETTRAILEDLANIGDSLERRLDRVRDNIITLLLNDNEIE